MDCVAFVSTPNKNPSDASTTKITNCKNLRDAIGNNNYAFIDSGYKFMYDPFNDVNRWVPMNGDTAGLCVRTDNTNDPWYSPAGFNRGQVRGTIKVAFNPTKAERDEIYGYGINPIVTFSGEGTILFGDKTAQTRPSAFDRINVRRLFIVLEKAIAKAAKYSLFEFNDAFTRAQFKGLVEPFLRDVQARRGIVDFKVVCDEKNNTPQVIDSNQFVADIYVKPNRSINYIQLNFVATKTGVSFEEVGA
jgi:phage tail sheath protein FI